MQGVTDLDKISLTNVPVRPYCRTIGEMQSLDAKRFATYRNYQNLQEFNQADGEIGATLEKKVKAR